MVAPYNNGERYMPRSEGFQSWKHSVDVDAIANMYEADLPDPVLGASLMFGEGGGGGGRSLNIVPGYTNGSGVWNDSDVYNVYVETSTSVACGSVLDSFENITCNATNNATNGTGNILPNPLPLWQIGLFGFFAGATMIITILGNLIVLLSFILERTIRQPTNYFIASLAVSDLLIGSVSMPFYTVYLLFGEHWPLGEILCDLWLSVDYTVCLTSIYTVFCITIDRFCMVKIPAKYRNWRTENTVLTMIACTWTIPVLVFFISIFGWQYIVKERTVSEGMCYVQYMESAIFNCVLQVGYFWITLTVMCVLYTGIYKVALNLQQKSNAKRNKMTSLVSMAGQTMTKIGIGMTQQAAVDTSKLFPPSRDFTTVSNETGPNLQGTSTTSFSSGKNNDKEDDRSSSPAFPSDTDPSSSQSPNRSPKHRKDGVKRHKSKSNKKESNFEPTSVLILQKPPKGKNAKLRGTNAVGLVNKSAIEANNISPANPPASLPLPTLPMNHTDRRESRDNAQNPIKGDGHISDDEGIPSSPESGYENTALLSGKEAHNTDCSNEASYGDNEADTSVMPAPKGVDNTSDGGGSGFSVNAPPELMEGVLYIDQESLKSLQSSDNIRTLTDPIKACPPRGQLDITEEPESPVWKKRDSFIEKDSSNNTNVPSMGQGSKNSQSHQFDFESPLMPQQRQNPSVASAEHQSRVGDQATVIPISGDNLHRTQGAPVSSTHSTSGVTTQTLSTPNMLHVEAMSNNGNKPVSRLSTPDDIQPLNAGDGHQGNRSSKRSGGGSPLSSIVKTVKRSKRGTKEEKKKTAASRSENRARKALRTITIILGAFVLCWTPWHILSMIMGFCPKDETCVVGLLYNISYWLCYLNSPINPLCYAFANAQFKKTFIRILKLDWHKT